MPNSQAFENGKEPTLKYQNAVSVEFVDPVASSST